MTIGPAAGASMPPRVTSSDDLNAMIERVAPDVLALLADGVPRNKAAIVAVLADRHPKQDVKRAIARLSVIGRVELALLPNDGLFVLLCARPGVADPCFCARQRPAPCGAGGRTRH